MKHCTVLSFLMPLVAAHFKLDYPPARGFDEDKLGTFPCGGQDTVSTNRTQFPITGAPIQLNMGHTQSNIQVLLAVGNDPGSAFNYVLVPTFQESGPNNFCIGAGAITIPAEANVKEGTNATIQVITNGDPSGGLYNCADVTFTSTPLSQSDYDNDCKNSTGIQVRPLQGNAMNANQTTESGSSDAGGDDTKANGTTSTSAAAASATSKGLAGPQATAAKWGLAAAGLAFGVMAL